ncbi:MAG: DUF4968 domain-containing protein, partial [candidate division KSB1 bacterium]|nr:DUF4968 domain-containing protein [candidate division KSB1 bacterium]
MKISVCSIVFLIFPLMTFQSLALADVGNVTAVAREGNRLVLTCGNDVVVFQVCTEHILMVNYQPQGIEDPDTLVVANTHWPPCTATFDTSGNPITVQNTRFRIEINRKPMRFHGYDAGGACLFEEPSDEGLYENSLKLKIPPSNFYGIHNKPHGSTLTNNTGGLISAGSQGGAGAPFVWTPKGWGLLADTDGGRIDISTNRLVFSRPDSPNKRDLEVYFIFGSPKEIINGMTDISGKPPLFPKFTLGFLNTEWG